MMDNDQHTAMEMVDHVKHRYYGKYRGIVTAIDADTLRIKAKVPSVLGVNDTGWCMPCVPYAGKGVGIAFLPEEKAGVWIEFERGDLSYPVWVGCYWFEGEKPDDATPTVKVIVTAKGKSKLLFDDDANTITLTDSNNNKVTLSSDGITLERGANKIVVSDSSVSVNDGAVEVM